MTSTPSSDDSDTAPATTTLLGTPCYIDIEEAEGWSFALLTAAHHDLDDYLEMSRTPPPGGVASLVALTLALLEEHGQLLGMSREEMLKAFTLSMEPANFLA